MNGARKRQATARSSLVYTALSPTFVEPCSVPGSELVLIFSPGLLAKANSQGPFA